jgi:hypothetical protein
MRRTPTRCLPALLAAWALAARPTPAQLTSLGARLLEQCGAAAESCESNDRFGEALAVGDFDDDGFADLAIGVPGEDVDGVNAAGAIHVFYGGPGGFHYGASVEAVFDVADLAGTPEGGANFGGALAAGDFNCGTDDYDDLAVGEPDANVGEAGDAGQVWVLLGSANGLTTTGRRYFDQGTVSNTETPEDGDHFGFALAAGDFNGGCDDLLIGVPDEDGTPLVEVDSGKVHVLVNTFTDEVDWTQTDTGCDSKENDDRFGYSLGIFDLDDDGKGELLVGSPFENRGNPGSGLFHVLSSTHSTSCLDQDNGLINGIEQDGDNFGASFAGGDFDGDGLVDLAVGASGENVPFDDSPQDGAGVVHVLKSDDDSSFATHGVRDQDDVGSGAEPLAGDRFGTALAAADFDGDGRADLAVGVPNDDGPGQSNAGEIAVFYGGASGLSGSGSRFHSDLPAAMPDSPNPADRFGAALATGDFDGNGIADLAIGIPGEALGSATSAGMATVLYGLDRATGAFGTVQFADGAVSISESENAGIFLVTRTGGAVLAATVDHARTGGTATPGVDFSYSGGTESWDAGDLSTETVLVNLHEDTLDEPNETIVIALSDPSTGTAVGSPSTLTVTIVDNDVAGSIQFLDSDFTVDETAGTVSLTLVRSGGVASGASVDYETSDASAKEPGDYAETTGTVTFGAGQTLRSITVPIVDDGFVEGDEFFVVTLSNPGGRATLGATDDTHVTIVDDEMIFIDNFERGDTSRWDLQAPAP